MRRTASALRPRILITASLTFALGLALYALVRIEPIANADEHITADIHRAAVTNGVVRQAAEAATLLGNPITLTILVISVAVALLRFGQRTLAGWLILVTAGGAVTETALKLVIRRARPGLETAILDAHGTSFPSGHAMNTSIVLGAIALAIARVMHPTLGGSKIPVALAATISVAVASTRILLGVHYLSDVTAGFLLAIVWLTFLHPTLPERD